MTYYYALSVEQPTQYRTDMPVEEIEQIAIKNSYLFMYYRGGIGTCAIITPEVQAIVGNGISVGVGDSLIAAVQSCLSQCVYTFSNNTTSDEADVVYKIRLATIESYYDIGKINESFTMQQFMKWNDISAAEASIALIELIRSGIAMPINIIG